MKIRYKGGRSHFAVTFERKGYYFTAENNRTLDIQDQRIVNYIFSLPNREEFEVVIQEPNTTIILSDSGTVPSEKTKIPVEPKPHKKTGGKKNVKRKIRVKHDH